MKKLTLLTLVLLSSFAFGQTYLTQTTLSAAVTSSQRTIPLASVSGLTAGNSFVFVDGEVMGVNVVNTSNVQVTRGSSGSIAASHASSAPAFLIPSGAADSIKSFSPIGSCTRSNLLYLPVFNSRNGQVSDCVSGVWVSALYSSPVTQPSLSPLPVVGALAVTGLETSGTAPSAATEMYCTELDVQFSQLLTGMGVLNGTTVGTDKHIVVLYDGAGNLLDYSATAGTTSANASTYQKHAFVKPYFLVGPGKYVGCIQTNGTTDTVRHVVTAMYGGQIDAFKLTGKTFGTIPASITDPATFTTALGPYFALY